MNALKALDRADFVYLTGLLLLFAGIALEFSFGAALMAIGAIVTIVSIATSFFVTWLSSRAKK